MAFFPELDKVFYFQTL